MYTNACFKWEDAAEVIPTLLEEHPLFLQAGNSNLNPNPITAFSEICESIGAHLLFVDSNKEEVKRAKELTKNPLHITFFCAPVLHFLSEKGISVINLLYISKTRENLISLFIAIRSRLASKHLVCIEEANQEIKDLLYGTGYEIFEMEDRKVLVGYKR